MNFFWFFRGRKAATNQHLPAQPVRLGSLSAIVWIVFAVLLTFGVWAYWAKLDQITRAPGAVIASSRTRIIHSQHPQDLQRHGPYPQRH